MSGAVVRRLLNAAAAEEADTAALMGLAVQVELKTIMESTGLLEQAMALVEVEVELALTAWALVAEQALKEK
jgi:hypothetical protein